MFDADAAQAAAALVVAEGPLCNTAELFARLQSVMSDHVGPFRTADGLAAARDAVHALRAEAGTMPPGKAQPHDLTRVEWFSLRHALLVAESVILAATARTESRGSHQREDFPHLDPDGPATRFVPDLRRVDFQAYTCRQRHDTDRHPFGPPRQTGQSVMPPIGQSKAYIPNVPIVILLLFQYLDPHIWDCHRESIIEANASQR